MKIKIITTFCLSFFYSYMTHAQFTEGLNYGVQTNISLSTGNHTPFWLVANKHGLSSIERNNAYLKAGIFRDKEKEKILSYSFGLELAALHRYTSDYVIQQAYAEFNYKWLGVSIGSKERTSELKDDYLSSGGLTFSTNARPVPQVRFEIGDYVIFPYTKEWLHIKGHVAWGKFTDNTFQKDFTKDYGQKYTKNSLYHSKALFTKIENKNFPLTIELGMEMAAQFGGTCYYANGSSIKTPTTFKDYLKVFFGQSGGSDASTSDQINALGNHLGSYHLALGYQWQEWNFRGYYEHFFEDGSGMGLDYGLWKDGLSGLEVTLPTNRYLSKIVFEYLYTKHQSGAFHIFPSDNPEIGQTFTGADNYYNNGQYAGWEHWGMGIGNPILVSPIYNENGILAFLSNRAISYHTGLAGNPSNEVEYRILMTFARHWGTYATPYPTTLRNRNFLAEATYGPEKLEGWSFTGALGIDYGRMLGRSIGGSITIRKTGLIGKRK